MEKEALERLRAFRQVISTTFGCRRDALAEILDALLTSPVIEHPVHLSLAPGFQRAWGSIYDALNAGTMPLPRLEQVVATHPLETPTAWYAVDASLWPRNDAETSAERGYYYHRSPHAHDESIIAGWNYSWLVQLPERCSSWTAPLRVRRMQPGENINQVAAEQIRSFLRQRTAGQSCPTFTFDAGYDPVQLGVALAGEEVEVLLRLRADRTFYADPPPGPTGGRPRRHGTRVRLCRSDYLAHSYSRVEDHGCPLWVGATPMLERAPSHSPYASQAGHATSPPARPRDPHPAGGGASPQTDHSASATLALVVGTDPPGSGNDLAGLCRPVLD